MYVQSEQAPKRKKKTPTTTLPHSIMRTEATVQTVFVWRALSDDHFSIFPLSESVGGETELNTYADPRQAEAK